MLDYAPGTPLLWRFLNWSVSRAPLDLIPDPFMRIVNRRGRNTKHNGNDRRLTGVPGEYPGYDGQQRS